MFIVSLNCDKCGFKAKTKGSIWVHQYRCKANKAAVSNPKVAAITSTRVTEEKQEEERYISEEVLENVHTIVTKLEMDVEVVDLEIIPELIQKEQSYSLDEYSDILSKSTVTFKDNIKKALSSTTTSFKYDFCPLTFDEQMIMTKHTVLKHSHTINDIWKLYFDDSVGSLQDC